jgi:L,D-transpeptidase catalytic domain
MVRPFPLLLVLAFVAACGRDVPGPDPAAPAVEPAARVDAAPLRPATSAPVAPAQAPATSAASAASAASPTNTVPTGPCPPGWTCDYAAFADPARRAAVSSLLVQKARHQLHLVAGRTILASYSVALGSGGLGQKLYEGDKTTPIGTYKITGKYPSRWHTYLAIDYPAPADVARHAAAVERGEVPKGKGPGSAIAIHGHRQDQPSRLHKVFDWTLGCVALDNDEIDVVAGLAPVGTPVVIEP